VFVGTNQTKVSFEVASTLQSMGERVEYIKISGNGKNALDFHIAFYIGQIVAKEPEAYFHVISNDGGFDPLIQHLRSKQICASRSSDITEIPIIKVANPQSPTERLHSIIQDLQRRGSSRPKSAKALAGTVNSLFQKQLPEQELKDLLGALQKQGCIKLNGTEVVYSLPSE
jgi:PIN domain